MSATEYKLGGFARTLVSVTVFALISVASSANVSEPRRCYWCGPLAEQVHRSRRAPPCDAIKEHETTCEPGLTHCAIVASSPPYVESRYCVKMYQDECYTLYCNSTKTWKMTCPCRGDLCNGPNTEREKDAFAVLDKIVAKTLSKRITRSAIPSPHLIKENANNHVAHNHTKMEDNDSSQNITEDEGMLSDEPINENKVNLIDGDEKDTLHDSKENAMNVTDNKIEINIDSNINHDHSSIVINMTDEKPSEINIKEHEGANIAMTSVESVTKPSIEAADDKNLESITLKDVKTNLESPTAEALQQSVSSIVVEKTTEQITTESTTQANIVQQTTNPTKPEKNNALSLSQNRLTLILICLGLYFTQ